MKPEPQPGFWRARGKSFACAFRGIALLLHAQANARIHLVATVLVIAAGFAFHVSRGEWLSLAFAIGIVWIAEAANTAIEVLADRITPDRDEQIGRAKDLAAGAVLLAAITAGVVGVIVLGPHLWALLRGHAG
jgi:diacylglycerol kinase (ATP)